MRFIQSSSLWGNTYRHRFYIDGKRVKEWQFDSSFNVMSKSGVSYIRTMEESVTSYRIIWETV